MLWVILLGMIKPFLFWIFTFIKNSVQKGLFIKFYVFRFLGGIKAFKVFVRKLFIDV